MDIKKTEGRFPSTNGINTIHYTRWQPDAPWAVLLIAHGMAEHIDRYDAFARYLAAAGIAVYGNDHLGHGRSAGGDDNLGFVSEENGHLHLVEDIEKMRVLVAREHPGLPVALMGHSMGSFIARAYCALHPQTLEGAIFMGTAGPNPAAKMGLSLNRTLSAVRGKRAKSGIFDQMTSGAFNKAFENPRTPVDWISSDPAEVDKYIADPWSGFRFTLSGYNALLSLLAMISQEDWAAKLRKDMPVLLVAGAEDPVGDMGKGVRIIYDRLVAAGMQDVRIILYEGMRHEILNETGRERVYADLLDWCKTTLRGGDIE